MRTIIIWDSVGIEPISFMVLDGDYSHLDRVYINEGGDEDNDKKQSELSALLCDDETETQRDIPKLDKFPKLEDGDVVIVAGFLP